MNLVNKTKQLSQLSFKHQCWAVFFFFSSLFFNVSLRFISMPKLAQSMGRSIENRQVSTLANEDQQNQAKEMGDLMARVANNTPWGCSCLTQAICVKRLLNWYKVPSVLYLGGLINNQVNRRPPEFKAHAWVDVRSDTVIGGPQNLNYKVVASYINLNFQ